MTTANPPDLINQYPDQFHWHQPHSKTTTTCCELTLLSAYFCILRIVSYGKWGIRPVTRCLLPVADCLLRAATDLQHTTSCSGLDPVPHVCHYRLLNSRHAEANREFRLFWAPLSRVLVIETVVIYIYIYICCSSITTCSFIFHIHWRSLCGYHVSWSKVSAVTSDELTTIFLRQRISMSTRGNTKRRCI